MARKKKSRKATRSKPVGRDFLDEIIEEATAESAEFPPRLRAAEARRAFVRKLAEERRRQGLSQADVAERMGTSQPAIARLEASEDARESTIDLYAAALGKVVARTLRSAPS